MPLSDLSSDGSDGDDDPLPDPVPGGPMGGEATGRRARAHQGAKQVARAAGDGKRRRVFTPPLPPNWQRTEAGGYQEYKLPPDSRLYQWRSFTYTDEYKKGEEKTVAPAPPTLFPDKFLFMNHPKKKISEAMADDVFVDEPVLGLWRRLGARVIRLTYDYFQRVELDTCGATAHTLRPHNHSSFTSCMSYTGHPTLTRSSLPTRTLCSPSASTRSRRPLACASARARRSAGRPRW